MNDEDAAVAVVNIRRGVLLVLNVAPAYRSQGVGRFLLNYLRPNFARVIESAVPWFERNGYACTGTPKQGRKFKTYVMIRKELIGFAGRAAKIFIDGCHCSRGWEEEAGHPAQGNGAA
ncbi:MAG: hypothetical protein KGL39_13685 [Patescibacteria group bacterium]|nr:hypothetical protein [Patescibacteria group bacterium]